MLPVAEGGRHVRVDVELAENRVPPTDQHDQLGLGVQIAGQIVADRPHVGNVLVLAGRYRRAADSLADGNALVLGVASCMRLEHQLVTVQHVGVHRRVRRAETPELLAGELEQRFPAGVVQVRGTQHPDDLPGRRRSGGCGRH